MNMEPQNKKNPMVIGKSLQFPFSKGILSRRLIDIGFEATEAYAIAENIEAELKQIEQEIADMLEEVTE